MEVVVIGVTQRERTRSDQPASWEITSPPFFFFYFFLFFSFFFYKPCVQQHFPNPTTLPLCSLLYILVQLKTKHSITAFAEQHKLGGIARINHKCVHCCRRQLYRPER